MRVLIAVDVPDGMATEDVAQVVDMDLPYRWYSPTGASVWTPEEFGQTLADRDVADAVDGALIDAVNGARDVVVPVQETSR